MSDTCEMESMRPGWQSALRALWPGALLFLLACVLYAPTLLNGFIWDDNDYVTQNVVLLNLHGLWRIWTEIGVTPQYYPLVHTSYWLEYRLWGLHPMGYHLTNVLLHAANACLLWVLLRRLGVGCAWFAAALFALHPVHVETVAWVTERKNVLSLFFYLLAALSYLRFIRVQEAPSRPGACKWSYVLALLFYLFALLSKTVTCSFPVAVLLVLWWKRGRIGRRDVRSLIPFFVVGLAMGCLTAWMERVRVGAHGEEFDLSWLERVLIAGRALWFYLGKLLWPTHLVFIYPRWSINPQLAWQYAFPVAALLVLAALWSMQKRLGRGVVAAALFFAVTLFPALGFFNLYPMRYSFVADHYQYQASIGILALIGAAVAWAANGRGKPVRLGLFSLCACVLLLLGGLCRSQIPAYKDLEALWMDTLEKNPNAVIAHNNLAIVLFEQGDVAGAIHHFETALRIEPGNDELWYHYGAILARVGRYDLALQRLQGALSVRPENALVHLEMGNVLLRTGDQAQALVHLREVVRLQPDQAAAHCQLARTLVKLGKQAEAVEHFERALQLEPRYSEALEGLARLQKQGSAR